MRFASRQASSQVTTSPAGETSDSDLVASARLDPVAFEWLYRRYRDPVLRFCFYGLGNWEDAADATQQVFINAFTHLHQFEDRGDSFRSWLFQIARNDVNDRRRRRSRSREEQFSESIDIEAGGPSIEDTIVIADDHQRLLALIDGLSDGRRDVCELRFAGLKDVEVARLLGKSEGAVRTTFSRAIGQLREQMAQEQGTAGLRNG